eukprot:1381089-Rhodomonas_salina.1
MMCAVLSLRMLLRDVRYWASVWCYAVCGTELAYAEQVQASRAGSVNAVPPHPILVRPDTQCPVFSAARIRLALARSIPPKVLRLSYAMPGTDSAYCVLPVCYLLRIRYGTDIAYAATRLLRDVRLCCYQAATHLTYACSLLLGGAGRV